MASIATKSTLFEIPYHQTHKQWRSTLHEIKQLYIQRQYKRCVNQCSSILASIKEPIYPVYKVYLYFYSALCYEAMGRYAHEYSSKKVPLLSEAKDCFGVALGALPGPVPVDMGIDHDGAVDEIEELYIGLNEFELGYDDEIGGLTSPTSISPSRSFSRSRCPSPSTAGSEGERRSRSRSRSGSGSTSPAESIITSITEIIDKTLDSTEDDPFISDCEDAIGIDIDIEARPTDAKPAGDIHEKCNAFASTSDTDNGSSSTNETGPLVPSPLQVRKTPRPRPLVLKVPNLDGNDGSSTPSHSPTRVQTILQLTQAYDQGQTPIMAVQLRPLPLRLPLQIKTAGGGVLGSRPGTRLRIRNERPSQGSYSCCTPTQKDS